ncbi:MAG: hypothetical protein HOQ28_05440 [Thermoleophilia bacterium]|nr:hypothetical protein [Thermoleophilia bacterium]
MRVRSTRLRAVDWLRTARPAPLLAVLALLELAVVLWLALRTQHNGWLWYSGGDATEYWTSQWAVAHGLIPQAVIGWGLPIFYGWVPLLAGPSLLVGVPVIVLFHALALVPLALVLVWAIADRLYGRLYAWSVALVWALAPLLAVWALGPGYGSRFESQVLAPHWAGLTDMGDFPSLVAILATAWATIRAVQNGRFSSALGAGVLGGIALGIKPSNGYFVPAVAVLLVAWHRQRGAVGWALGVAPGVLTLLVWKRRGLGTIPVLSAYAPKREASGTVLGLSTDRYLPLDWHHLSFIWGQLREVVWDLRLLQFLLVAAALGAVRRNPRAGLFLITWFVVYCVLKGSSAQADVETTSYFRLTLPGLAAFVLLIPAIGFLWPGVRREPLPRAPRESQTLPRRSPLTFVAAAAALLPLVVVLASEPAPFTQPRLARYFPSLTSAPISPALRTRVRMSNGVVKLSWQPARRLGSTAVVYGILRTTGNDGCTYPTEGAGQCILTEPIMRWTPNARLNDHPGRGHFFYRVAAVADFRASPDATDVMLLGPAVSVRL